jgi:hypothetical protein
VAARDVSWVNRDLVQHAIHAVMLFVARCLPTHAFAVLVHRVVMLVTSSSEVQ